MSSVFRRFKKSPKIHNIEDKIHSFKHETSFYQRRSFLLSTLLLFSLDHVICQPRMMISCVIFKAVFRRSTFKRSLKIKKLFQFPLAMLPNNSSFPNFFSSSQKYFYLLNCSFLFPCLFSSVEFFSGVPIGKHLVCRKQANCVCDSKPTPQHNII